VISSKHHLDIVTMDFLVLVSPNLQFLLTARAFSKYSLWTARTAVLLW